MIRYIFAFIVLLHGLIHFTGVAKAFNPAATPQIVRLISKPEALAWMATAILFIITVLLLLMNKGTWWVPALCGLLLSQALIIATWQSAKYGSIANLLILVAAIAGYGSWHFEKKYRKDITQNMRRCQRTKEEILTAADIQHLPGAVRKYLYYTGVINKPKIKSLQVVCEGEIREKGKGWFPFRSEQANFFDVPTRLFFMKGKMSGITVPGYHAYKDGIAGMDIKIYGLYPIVAARGPELDKAETVTLFNDMCIMAPASLIDRRISWQEIDSLTVRAEFTVRNIHISAILYFNAEGALINFISDDRYEISAMKQYRFSTPVGAYKEYNGYRLASYGETIWHYPEGEFCYGRFHMKKILYNRRL